MVTFKNLSAYAGDPPKDGGSRKITGGPLYALAAIQALAARPGTVNLWTEKAGMEYFLKFALSKTGKLVLMVSCHA